MKRRYYRKPWTYKDPAREQVFRQRNREIFEALSKGLTLEETGKQHGITRERVRQIAKKLNAPAPMDVRRRLKEQRDKAEQERLLRRPCFVCGKPARSTRVAKRRWERLYCEKCRVLVTKDTNVKAAMNVRASSLILAAKRPAICTICRVKLLGSNAYRGILCTRHDKALKAVVHNGRQAMRNHPELDWQRILRTAALCRQCFQRQASPGMTTCRKCRGSD